MLPRRSLRLPPDSLQNAGVSELRPLNLCFKQGDNVWRFLAMSKTFGLVAAAALLASVTAFAQNAPSSSSAPDQAQAPAAAPADESANSEEKSTQRHHRRHGGST